MDQFILLFSILAVSIYLFPTTWRGPLQNARDWLDHYQLEQAKAITDAKRVEYLHRAWLLWASRARNALKQQDKNHYLTLAQALAAGERYLKSAVPTDAPRIYQLTEEICNGIRDKLNELRRAKKMGPGRRDPAPAV